MNLKVIFLGFSLFFALLLAKAIHDESSLHPWEREVSLTASPLVFSNFSATRTFNDERDGQEYPIVQIGDLNWMGKNLNFKTTGSSCFQHQDEKCGLYGRLYSYSASRKACPKGWRLPTHKEWKKLKKAGQGNQAAPLVDGSRWDEENFQHGNNALGMNILPAGRLDHYNHEGNDELFSQEGISSSFWLDDDFQHWHLRWGKSHTHKHGNLSSQHRGFSIRCVCESKAG